MGDGQESRLMRTPKEGERILAPTRRPDGTLRKPVRIRAGYTPQDEVAIYQSKGALMRKAADLMVPPGYDLSMDAKLKTKSEKRNERKKEKKLQATPSTSDKEKSLDPQATVERFVEEDSGAVHHRLDSVESVMDGINKLSVSFSTQKLASPNGGDCSVADINKRIRALKKKIRLAEAQLKGEEKTEKITKIDGWHEELKLLEFKGISQVQ